MLKARVLTDLPTWFRSAGAGKGTGKDEKKTPSRSKWNPMRYEVRIDSQPDLADEKKRMEEDAKKQIPEEPWDRIWRASELIMEALGEVLSELMSIEEPHEEDILDLFADVTPALVTALDRDVPGLDFTHLTYWIQRGGKALFLFPQDDTDLLASRMGGWVYDFLNQLSVSLLAEEGKQIQQKQTEHLLKLPEFAKRDPKMFRQRIASLFDLRNRAGRELDFKKLWWRFLEWDNTQRRKNKDPVLLAQLLSQSDPESKRPVFEFAALDLSGLLESVDTSREKFYCLLCTPN